MRVLFFGYSEMGAAALEVVSELGHPLAGVVTHRHDPDENRWFRTPAEVIAELDPSVPVHYSGELSRPELVTLAEQAAPDLILSVFYRNLLPEAVLSTARLAALNLHPSLLPAYRGRAPVNWVLVKGEEETGVTLHHMVAQADAGDIVDQERIAIAPRETALSLSWKVVEAGRQLLQRALPLVARGEAPRRPQDLSQGFYCGRRRPADGRIDWRDEARAIDGLVRAVATPWPGAFGDIELPGEGPVTVLVDEGQPVGAPFPEDDRPAPGSVRLVEGRLQVATGDRWFELTEWRRLDHPPDRERH